MPTPRFGLPYIAQGQVQKEVTHNDALNQLDALVDLYFLDRDLTAPPGSPIDGDTYLVAASPTGAWAGQAGKLAYSIDGAWRFYAPMKGLIAYIADEQAILIYTGTSWADWSTLLTYQNLPMLGVNTSADATNKLAVKSNAVLFAALEVANGGTGDIRFTVNKEAAAKTASLLFQDNFSGRAEIGLLGNDDFAFKVSPDGSAYFVAFSIDRTSGRILPEPGKLVATAEINLGTVALHSGKFTLTDAAIKPTSKLLVQLAPGPYTGKGTRADEAQMYAGITFAASPGNGLATVYWSAPRGGAAKRNIKVNYQIG
jgi:hypothetical protein